MLPIRQCPLSLFSISFILNSPRWKVPMHFIKSSSIPPQVVTMQSTILCWTRNLMISRMPQDAILEVQPRKMVHLTWALQAGSLVSSSSRSLRGSSVSLHEIMELTISIACDKWVAWRPMVAKLLKSSSQFTPLLKSYPLTTLDQSALFLNNSSWMAFSTVSGEMILDSWFCINNKRIISWPTALIQQQQLIKDLLNALAKRWNYMKSIQESRT